MSFTQSKANLFHILDVFSSWIVLENVVHLGGVDLTY